MGLPPRLVLPSLPTVRLPFDRLAASAGRIRLPRLADQITWARRSVIDVLRREPRQAATPGLGPLRLERDLELAQPRLPRLNAAVAHLRLDRVGAAAGRIPLGRTADGPTRLGDAVASARAAAGRIPLDRLGPIGRVDRKVLAILSVLVVAGVYGLLFANPAAVQQQAPAAVAAAKPGAAPDSAAKIDPAAAPDALAKPDPASAAKPDAASASASAAKPDPASASAANPSAAPAPGASADPFAQSEVNDHLRALRKAVGPGDQVRNLMILGDGTMGVTIVNNGLAESVMVRGNDLAIEPFVGEPQASAALNLVDVRGGAITRVLAKAESVFRLPTAQLASLRLTEHPSKAGTFQWKGVWNDPARTTLYADQSGQAVSTSRPR
ncbi:MAG: hypothetical protein JHD16_10425 [Solirubrobacteraceae bacterium]|nr:hypothetical protein [Solirubrobacteraceae bacterium]